MLYHCVQFESLHLWWYRGALVPLELTLAHVESCHQCWEVFTGSSFFREALEYFSKTVLLHLLHQHNLHAVQTFHHLKKAGSKNPVSDKNGMLHSSKYDLVANFWDMLVQFFSYKLYILSVQKFDMFSNWCFTHISLDLTPKLTFSTKKLWAQLLLPER